MKRCPFTQAAVHLVCGNLWEEGSSILLKVCLLEYQLSMKEMLQTSPNVKNLASTEFFKSKI